MMELEDLVTELAPQLLRYCLGRTGRSDLAEEVAQEAGIPAEIVPAPPGTRAKCGLALATLEKFVDPLADVLDDAGVVFYVPGRV